MRPNGSFTDGRIEVNGFLYEPNISGTPVSEGPSLVLSLAGGYIFYEIHHDTETTYVAPNHEISTSNVYVSLVTMGLGDSWPYPSLSYVSASPVDTVANSGLAYVFLLQYGPGGEIVTYGGNSIIDTEFSDPTLVPVTSIETTYYVVA